MNKERLAYFLPPVLLSRLATVSDKLQYNHYKKLLSPNTALRGAHTGQTCYIMGSGASIEQHDLTQLADKNIFFLNNFYVHPDYSRMFGSKGHKYYLTGPSHPPQDLETWHRFFKGIEDASGSNVTYLQGINNFSASVLAVSDKYKLFNGKKVFYFFPGIKVDRYYRFDPRHFEMNQRVWKGGAASIYAISWAIYMGFRKVVLLGMDMNYFNFSDFRYSTFYKTNATHLQGGNKILEETAGDVSPNTNTFETMAVVFRQYSYLARFFPQIEFYNTSPVSTLDMFPKVSYDEALQL